MTLLIWWWIAVFAFATCFWGGVAILLHFNTRSRNAELAEHLKQLMKESR